MLIRRHLPNERSNHSEIAKPLIFKGLTGSTETVTNGSITDRYTLYTLIVRVLHALYWKVGHENKRKQTGTLRHIGLIISDLQKKNRRF